jgi:Kef-type K+ transport system membrane component KefB
MSNSDLTSILLVLLLLVGLAHLLGYLFVKLHQGNVLNFVYWLGLLLLMFLSGAETRHLFSREERREVGWLVIVGTGIPFVLGLTLGPWLIRSALCAPPSTYTFKLIGRYDVSRTIPPCSFLFIYVLG